MKKIRVISLCIVVIMGLICFTGCSSDRPYSDCNVTEYVKVGKYKGLKTKEIKISVTEDDIKEAINTKLDAAKKNETLTKGTKIKDGDTVNIDYVGTMDGKAFEGGTAKKQDLTIGSGTFIEGFESGLIGKKVGEKNIKLNLAFPLNYQASELAGKDVVFTVTINSAGRMILPKYDENFIKTQGKYKSKAEYEKALGKELVAKKKEEAKTQQKNDLWDQVLSGSKMKKYPEEELNNYLEFNSKQIDDYAEQSNVTRDEMLVQYGFSSEDDFKKVNEEASKLRVEQELILTYIAQEEKIEISKDDIESVISELETQGFTEETVLQASGRNMEDYAYLQSLYKKVMDFIWDNAEIV